jgi:hypothetical protein
LWCMSWGLAGVRVAAKGRVPLFLWPVVLNRAGLA